MTDDTIDEEKIDKTQWLPRGTPIVNEYRLSKPDMHSYEVDGEIRYAQALVNNLVNFLEAGNVLDSQQVKDAQTYEIWQICFLSQFQIKENPIYYPREIRDMVRAVEAENLDIAEFERVILPRRGGLTESERKCIEHCLKPGATDFMRWQAARHVESYKAAFNRLSAIMQTLREEHLEREDKKNQLQKLESFVNNLTKDRHKCAQIFPRPDQP